MPISSERPEAAPARHQGGPVQGHALLVGHEALGGGGNLGRPGPVGTSAGGGGRRLRLRGGVLSRFGGALETPGAAFEGGDGPPGVSPIADGPTGGAWRMAGAARPAALSVAAAGASKPSPATGPGTSPSGEPTPARVGPRRTRAD